VGEDELARVIDRVHQSWGRDRLPATALQAEPPAH